MSTVTISSLDDLKSILLAYNIDISKYGQGSAKTLTQLHKETVEGESYLSIVDGQLIRTGSSFVTRSVPRS